MKKELKKMTQEWMQMERKTPDQRRLADEFYEKELMLLIEEEFIKRIKSRFLKKQNILLYP